MKVWLKPGLVNRLHLGKRWLAIILLSVATIVSVFVALLRQPTPSVVFNDEVVPLSRRQVPAVKVEFDSRTDHILSFFARPGSEEGLDVIERGVDLTDFREELAAPIRARPDDAGDAVLLKRIVATLKDEARVSLHYGETPERIIARLVERQRMEAEYRRATVLRVQGGKVSVAAANASFRLMGLAEVTEKEAVSGGKGL